MAWLGPMHKSVRTGSPGLTHRSAPMAWLGPMHKSVRTGSPGLTHRSAPMAWLGPIHKSVRTVLCDLMHKLAQTAQCVRGAFRMLLIDHPPLAKSSDSRCLFEVASRLVF